MPDDQGSAPIGHNVPSIPSPDFIPEQMADTYVELSRRRDALLDALPRVPETIEDDDTAGKVGDFVKQLAACVKMADSHRVAEKEPYLQGGRVIDGFFKKITDPLAAAKKTVEARLTAHARRKAEEERRRREAEERAAREEAQRAAREAAERAAAIADDKSLDDAISAEALAKQAAADAAKATRAADAKAADLSRVRGDHGAVSSLHTTWEFDGLDRDRLDLESLRHHLPGDALEKAVRSFIRAGGRELRGVRIFENTHVVVR